MKLPLISLLFLLHQVASHSWIACTDYMVKNGKNWNPRKCRGFPRDGYRYTKKRGFGLDTMYNHEPQQNGQTCKTKYRKSSYRKNYPQAVYYPGQQVVLVHPMKNHGADYCTNKYIPDHGSMIYRGRKNTDRDRKLNFYKRFEVANLGISPFGPKAGNVYRKYPKPGYQNGPNFCKNTDKSMGTYSFNVPKNIAPGEYTFVWVWAFSRPDHVYTTCFEVTIAPNKKKRDLVLKKRGFGLYVPCGGKTSDLSPGSTVGCNNRPRKIYNKKTLHLTPKTVPSTPKTVLSTLKAVPSTPKAVPSTPKAVPSTLKTVPSTPKAVPSTPKAAQSTQKAVPSTLKPSIITPVATTTRPKPTFVAKTTTEKSKTKKVTNRLTTAQKPKSANTAVRMYQTSGLVDLPKPSKGTKQRTVRIQFGCAAIPRFQNARLIKRSKRQSFTVVQRIHDNRKRPIYFRATFPGSCSIKSRNFRAFVVKET